MMYSFDNWNILWIRKYLESFEPVEDILSFMGSEKTRDLTREASFDPLEYFVDPWSIPVEYFSNP